VDDSTSSSNRPNNFKQLSQKKDFKKFEENYLPPEWIDLQEDIDDNILRIGQLFEELTPLR
jgi:hypothetical protein